MSVCNQVACVTTNFPSLLNLDRQREEPCLAATARWKAFEWWQSMGRARQTCIERRWGGVQGCWSWSVFICDALPSGHLHQVDIWRVYSGVCNCILSPVLHCQPWKWNLINPDQFLMYEMNWQGFKKGGATIQIRWMIHSIFVPQVIELPPPPPSPLQLHTTLTSPKYDITSDFFFFLKAGLHTGLKNPMYK